MSIHERQVAASGVSPADGAAQAREVSGASHPWSRAMAWAAWFLGLLFLMPGATLSGRQELAGQFSLDDIWRLGIPERLMNGEIIGRDFLFTYGPLFQIIHAFGLLLPPHNLSSLIRWQWVPEGLLTTWILWELLRLTGAKPRVRAFAYLLWCAFCLPNHMTVTGVKPFLALLLCGLGSKALIEERKSAGLTLPALLLWAGSIPVMIAYSFDSGMFTLVSFVLVLIVAFLTAGTRRNEASRQVRGRVWRAGLFMALGLLGFLGFCFGLPAWRGYLPGEWALSTDYIGTMATAIAPGDYPVVRGAVVLAAIVLPVSAWFARRQLNGTGSISAPTAVLLGGACYALVWTRTGFTRSDVSHVFQGICPLVFLIGVFVPVWAWSAGRRYWSLVPVAVAVFFACKPYPAAGFRAAEWTERWSQWRTFTLASDGLVIGPSDRAVLAALSRQPTDALYEWPNDTTFNMLSGRRSANYTVQNYSGHAERLQAKTIELMRADPEMPVLYDNGAPQLDSVPNSGRTPLIFEYLLTHYELPGSPAGTLFLLKPRPGGEDATWVESPVSADPDLLRPRTQGALEIGLGGLKKPIHESDLLTLQLRCSASRLLTGGKVGQLLVLYQFAGEPGQVMPVPLPPDGRAHPAILAFHKEGSPDFMKYFSPQPLPPSGPALQYLALAWSPLDQFSVPPEYIAVEGVWKLSRIR